MLYFQQPEYFYIFAAIPVMVLVFYFLIKWKKRSFKKIGDEVLVRQLIEGFSPAKFLAKFILVILAFALCIVAVAGLMKPEGSQKVKRNGIDIMIALDVSNSMLADDIKPSRLERAKQVVSKLIDKLSDDRIGIVVFAGRAYLQMPMTTDHSAAKMYLSSATPEDVPTQGTNISEALKMCYTSFNTKEKKYRSIILITDGEDHDEDAIKTTKDLAHEGVVVNTIGLGSMQGSPIKDPQTNDYKKDENGNTVISKLDEEELRSIAQNGNGIYQFYSSADVLADNLEKKLSGIGQTTLTDNLFITYENFFWYFLIGALILLVAEFFISERKKIPAGNLYKTALLIFFISFCNFSFSQDVNKNIKTGNEAYIKNDYSNASTSYQKALQKSPDNTVASYNLGNTLYKTDKPDEALGYYDKAIKTATDNDTKAKAWYNKGVTLQKQNKLPECINAYKNALKISPQDEDTRQNLERALMQLKQQQKQQDKKDKKEQKKPKDEKDKKDQDKKEDQKQDEPKPQPSKISQQDAEEKLKALLEHEKDLQDKYKKVRVAAPDKPKKDW